jgi:hypothetical protein
MGGLLGVKRGVIRDTRWDPPQQKARLMSPEVNVCFLAVRVGSSRLAKDAKDFLSVSPSRQQIS